MTPLDPRSDTDSTDDLLDAALPAALLVAVASWLPAGLLLFGYAVRVLRAELGGDDGLPPLTDVRELVVTGFRAATVVAVFQLPTLLVLGWTYTSWVDSGWNGLYGDPLALLRNDPVSFVSFAARSPGNDLTAVGLVLTLVVAFLAAYVGTVGLIGFAATDRLGAAFDADVLRAGARSARFRRAFLLASVLGVVGSAIAGMVSFVPIVGPFVGAFVELFAFVGALRLAADGFDERVILGPASSRVADGAAVGEGAVGN